MSKIIDLENINPSEIKEQTQDIQEVIEGITRDQLGNPSELKEEGKVEIDTIDTNPEIENEEIKNIQKMIVEKEEEYNKILEEILSKEAEINQENDKRKKKEKEEELLELINQLHEKRAEITNIKIFEEASLIEESKSLSQFVMLDHILKEQDLGDTLNSENVEEVKNYLENDENNPFQKELREQLLADLEKIVDKSKENEQELKDDIDVYEEFFKNVKEEAKIAYDKIQDIETKDRESLRANSLFKNVTGGFEKFELKKEEYITKFMGNIISTTGMNPESKIVQFATKGILNAGVAIPLNIATFGGYGLVKAAQTLKNAKRDYEIAEKSHNGKGINWGKVLLMSGVAVSALVVVGTGGNLIDLSDLTKIDIQNSNGATGDTPNVPTINLSETHPNIQNLVEKDFFNQETLNRFLEKYPNEMNEIEKTLIEQKGNYTNYPMSVGQMIAELEAKENGIDSVGKTDIETQKDMSNGNGNNGDIPKLPTTEELLKDPKNIAIISKYLPGFGEGREITAQDLKMLSSNQEFLKEITNQSIQKQIDASTPLAAFVAGAKMEGGNGGIATTVRVDITHAQITHQDGTTSTFTTTVEEVEGDNMEGASGGSGEEPKKPEDTAPVTSDKTKDQYKNHINNLNNPIFGVRR